jgi:hypothetical protein
MKRLPQTAAREPYRVLWQQATGAGSAVALGLNFPGQAIARLRILHRLLLRNELVSEIVFREQVKPAGF